MDQKKLYNKDFLILVVGQIISLFGSAIQRFALSLYILEISGSASIFASILAFSVVPVIILAPFAGVMADRFNKKYNMVILDFISGIILLIYSIILFSGKDHYVVVAVMMLVLSGISTLYQPSVTSSIPLLSSEENLMRANGVVQQVSSLSNFLGPIIGGILYGFVGIKGVILINLASFFVSAIMECFLSIPFENKEAVGSAIHVFTTEIKESYYYLKDENPVVFRMCITSGLYNLFLVPLLSVGAPFIIKVFLGQSSRMYGVAEGAIAFGMIIGAMIVGKFPHKFHIRRIYRVLYGASVCMAMMAVAVLFSNDTAFSRNLTFVLFTVFAMGIMLVIGLANVVSAAFLQSAAPGDMLGKVTAFGTAFATICVPFGQIIFGWMLDLFENQVWLMILLSGIATLFVTFIVRWNVLQIKEDKTTEVSE